MEAGARLNEQSTYESTLRDKAQITPWASGGRSTPSNACGRSQPTPHGPCDTRPSPTIPAAARLGSNSVYAQARIPIVIPASAPRAVAPRQIKPPKKAEASCAIAANDSNPIEAS